MDYTLVSPVKYFVKNFELCKPRNLLISTELTVTKLQYNPPYCGFGTINAVHKNFLGSQSHKYFSDSLKYIPQQQKLVLKNFLIPLRYVRNL